MRGCIAEIVSANYSKLFSISSQQIWECAGTDLKKLPYSGGSTIFGHHRLWDGNLGALVLPWLGNLFLALLSSFRTIFGYAW